MNKVALLQITPVVRKSTLYWELWTSSLRGGARVNYYLPCKSIPLRLFSHAVNPDQEPKDDDFNHWFEAAIEYLQAVLEVKLDTSTRGSSRRRHVPVPGFGPAAALPLQRSGVIDILSVPTTARFDMLLPDRFMAHTQGRFALAAPAHRGYTQWLDCLVHYARDALRFTVYVECELPACVDADLIQRWKDSESVSLPELIQGLRSTSPWASQYLDLPIPAFNFVPIPAPWASHDPAILFDLSDKAVGPHTYDTSGHSSPLVVNYPALLDKMHNETWIWEEEGEIPSQQEVEKLLKLCLSSMTLIHCTFQDMLTLPRLGLATIRISWMCERLGWATPAAIENRYKTLLRKRQQDDVEAGEAPEEAVDYQGGHIFQVEPGIYRGHLEMLDFDTYYMSIMGEFPEILYQPKRQSEDDDSFDATPIARSFHDLVEKKRAITDDPLRRAAVKLSINVIYGCTGMNNVSISNRATAAAITAKGREIIQTASDQAAALQVVRRFGHTDSLLVQVPEGLDINTLDKITDAVNRKFQVIRLKRNERFCTVWVQNRTRYIGIFATALDAGGDWTPVMDDAMQIAHDTLLKMHHPMMQAGEVPTPAVAVKAMVKHFSTFAKFPGMLASNMPPAFKFATLLYTTLLMALVEKRRRAENVISSARDSREADSLMAVMQATSRIQELFDFAEEVSQQFSSVFVGEQLQLRSWIHFTGKPGQIKAVMRVRGKTDNEIIEGSLEERDAGDCDCNYWKRRLNERLHQQIREDMARTEAPAVITDATRYVDILLPLFGIEQRMALVKEDDGMEKRAAVSTWLEISNAVGAEAAAVLPDMEALTALALTPALPTLDASTAPPNPLASAEGEDKIRAILARYVEATRTFILQHPQWASVALDAFARELIFKFDLHDYIAKHRTHLSTTQIQDSHATRIEAHYKLRNLFNIGHRLLTEQLLPLLPDH